MLLLLLVVVPTFLLIAVGVVLLFVGDYAVNVIIGILVLALSGTAAAGVILVWVFVRREANLSALQSDFVSKVSHELRTPLTSIRLFTETLALRRGDPVAEGRCIEALGREATRLQELIDRLLDWGRMESGRFEYTMRPSSVRGIVSTALAASESHLHHRGTELSTELPDPGLTVVADQGSMVDALVNLLSNASKYGGGKVSVAVTENAGEVRICVSDNGPGIAKTEHQRIFQKFYRVDDRLSRAREGSGLGLAIVKHVMRAHQGKVEVESAPGKGSTFSLVLPSRAFARGGASLGAAGREGQQGSEPTGEGTGNISS